MSEQSQKKKTYDRGLWAEKLASGYLKLKGYQILETRYKTPHGEIDIIAAKKNLIAFIEVKARQSEAQALESITPKMRSRISNAALHYIAAHDGEACDYRFDVMAVSPPVIICHIENAWMMDT